MDLLIGHHTKGVQLTLKPALNHDSDVDYSTKNRIFGTAAIGALKYLRFPLFISYV
jgi:hypothetical protein